METYIVTVIQNRTYARRLVFTVYNDHYLIEQIDEEMHRPHWDQVPYTIESIFKVDRLIHKVTG